MNQNQISMAPDASEESNPLVASGDITSVNAKHDSHPLSSQDAAPAQSAVKEPRQHRVKGARRLTGRRSVEDPASFPLFIASQTSLENHKSETVQDEGAVSNMSAGQQGEVGERNHHQTRLIAQITEWIVAEKEKHRARKSKRKSRAHMKEPDRHHGSEVLGTVERTQSRDSLASDADELENMEALKKLESILESTKALSIHSSRSITGGQERGLSRSSRRRQSSFRALRRSSTAASSDTDYQDGDVMVPSCNVVLDNTKTLSRASMINLAELSRSISSVEGQAVPNPWLDFKNEIIRIAHTLKLKNWRSVPLDSGSDIDVERLSGALTNAVYVVSPPTNLVPTSPEKEDSEEPRLSRKMPQKLLLRIYGPQVEHLIDRDSELQILRRLARKRIGPRLLGTFQNGRFEEFFKARTLTASDLRIPDTSKQIAKRMRELHDGIELLDEERDLGPAVWRNWDKWVDRSEQIVTWLDRKVLSHAPGLQQSGRHDRWKRHGLLCGVPWPVFRKTVENYRAWLEKINGGPQRLRQQLIFAHNDTQYGNLLRLEPSGESPLLLPANEHKQLVVIDFEYASANVRGFEFANHFTEWCYDYHNEEKPYVVNISAYPTLEEQKRFLGAYLNHSYQLRSQPPTPSLRPSISGVNSGSTTSISAFMLDSRAPPAQIAEDERSRDAEIQAGVKNLLLETRQWRAACSAHWVAWGILQATIPEFEREHSIGETGMTLGTQDAAEQKPSDVYEDEEDGFDYLGYSRERALLFWGDMLELGIIKTEAIPESLLRSAKALKW